MKQYRQPKAGTNTFNTKQMEKDNRPKPVKVYSMLQFLQSMYKGDTNNEWQ